MDNDAERDAQIRELNRIRNTRDQQACSKALAALEKIAETGQGNILEAAIEYAPPGQRWRNFLRPRKSMGSP